MGCSESRPKGDDSKPVFKAQSPSQPAEPAPLRAKSEAAEPEEEEEEIPTFPDTAIDDKKRVLELFSLFDNSLGDKPGMLELAELKNVTIEVGNNNYQVLDQMAQMDYNGDGYVEISEWERYFAAIYLELSIDEFNLMLSELQQTGEHLSVIGNLVQIAQTTGDDGKVSEEEMAEAREELEQLTLEGPQKEMVEGLFKEWDFNGDGYIRREKLQSTGIDVGPKEQKVFTFLEAMDFNNDGKVEFSEMMAYFSILTQTMSAEEFQEVVSEMRDVAATERNVAAMIKLSQDAQSGEDAQADEEEEPEPPKLTPEREELVKQLFMTYSENLDEPIELSRIKDIKIDVGPAKEDVLASLAKMDANGDGKVEIDEMRFYFQYVGAELDDDMFEDVLKDLQGKAALGEAIKLYGGQ